MPMPPLDRSVRRYWWLLECAHYAMSTMADGEAPPLPCEVCHKLRRGVRREPGFAVFGD